MGRGLLVENGGAEVSPPNACVAPLRWDGRVGPLKEQQT